MTKRDWNRGREWTNYVVTKTQQLTVFYVHVHLLCSTWCRRVFFFFFFLSKTLNDKTDYFSTQLMKWKRELVVDFIREKHIHIHIYFYSYLYRRLNFFYWMKFDWDTHNILYHVALENEVEKQIENVNLIVIFSSLRECFSKITTWMWPVPTCHMRYTCTIFSSFMHSFIY